MKRLQNILTEITQLTTNIETNYPELYSYLEENPMTLPVKEDPHMDKKVMEDYLQSLKLLLKHHLETHTGKKK
ncbi:MAG: hypothetical protein HKO75_07045 [Flavobacteriaceae bacterium]|nr:hypothetical protein [Muriicola sp.]NNL39602.1 hypothetical protein [Flavobacteriaceae bacterium]